MLLNEFDIIQQYFKREARSTSVLAGVGDDCALLSVASDHCLAISMDTLVAGRHFPMDADPIDIGRRALCVSLSDLAAMAATPLWFTLGLTLPEASRDWLGGFSQGLFEVAERFECALVGGDTTKGPLTITVQVHGQTAPELALTRSGANSGDTVFVTGGLGDGAAALAMLEGKLTGLDDQQSHYLKQRFYCPEPQIAQALLLAPYCSSAIDISDGLVADLQHIAKASNVVMNIDVEKLPTVPLLEAITGRTPQWRQWQLTGGDDYQLAFTVPPVHLETVDRWIQTGQIQATAIGRVIARDTEASTRDRIFVRLHGQPYVLASEPGYQHFAAT